MAESRLQRWSRKKTGASKAPEPAAPPAAEIEVSPEDQELAINETLSEQEVLDKYNLPDPNAIELGPDITGFLRKEIPEFMRRKALRGLWRSNPVLAVLDGLNDYDEDYSAAASAGTAVKTLYKVGQGLIDKTRKADEPVENQSQEPAEVAETMTPAEGAETKTESVADKPAPEVATEPVAASARDAEAATAGPEAESTLRYRPRMRFDP